MSQHNAEIVRDVVDAVWHRRDFAAGARHLHPSVEWHNSGGFPGPQTCSGPEETVAFWKAFMEVFEHGGGTQVEDLAQAGDTVVVQVHSRGIASGSGIPIDQRWAITFQFADGLILRAHVRGDYAKALAAAGFPTG